MKTGIVTVLSTICVLTIAGLQGAAALDSRDETDGWESASPRDEIRPAFEFRKAGGPNHAGSLIIRADDRAGLDGHWAKAFPIQGGQYYRFRATQRAERIPSPRRSALARILWRDEQGRPVRHYTKYF